MSVTWYYLLPVKGLTPLKDGIKLWKICVRCQQIFFNEKICGTYGHTLSQSYEGLRGTLGLLTGGLRAPRVNQDIEILECPYWNACYITFRWSLIITDIMESWIYEELICSDLVTSSKLITIYVVGVNDNIHLCLI